MSAFVDSHALFFPRQSRTRLQRPYLSSHFCKRPSTLHHLPHKRPTNINHPIWTCTQRIPPWVPAFEAAVLNTPLSPSSAPQKTKPENATRGLSPARLRRLLTTIWRLAAPFWRAEKFAKWHGAACALLTILDSCVGAVFTELSGTLFTALNERNIIAFRTGSLTLFALCAVVVPLSACKSFVRSTFALQWQQFLTKRGLRLYFDGGNYYRLTNIKDAGEDVDNPDEVIHEQFAKFASAMVDFAMSNLTTAVELVLYSVMLLRIFPPLYFIILAIVLAGTLLINHIGRRLVDLQALLLRRTADFRFALARVRIHAESIAFYNGSKYEHDHTESKLDARASTKLELCKTWFPVDMFTCSFYFLPIALPLLVLGPLYFTGRIKLGELTKAQTAFSVLFQNLSLFIGDYEQYVWLGASVERLSRFVSTLEEGQAPSAREFRTEATRADGETLLSSAHAPRQPGSEQIRTREDGNLKGVYLTRVSVDTPDGERRLISDVTLDVGAGERVLIVGRSGVGKTSLLRAIAGLWTSGSGTLARPLRERMMFLPQRGYCAQGSLRAQLEFPGRAGRFSDAALVEALGRVRLGQLVRRVGGLDAVREWTEVLSAGERQRVAVARAVLACADVVLVDEGMAGVDEEMERVLVGALAEVGCAVVSVGHRASLVRLHERVLVLGEDGSGVVVPAREYAARIALRWE